MSRSAPATAPSPTAPTAASGTRQRSKDAVLVQASRELVFAVVGHVGSGTSTVAKQLAEVLRRSDFNTVSHISEQPVKLGPPPSEKVFLCKASDAISAWATERGHAIPEQKSKNTLQYVIEMQDLGDRMRSEDHAAVARSLVLRIREIRAEKQQVALTPGKEVLPDGHPRAYILDSIRHPAEVELLRRVYGSAFALIGVVCEEDERIKRIQKKYRGAGEADAIDFMKRDADDEEDHGQHVAKAFFLADFFVDNTVPRTDREGQSNPRWNIPTHLDRFVKIVTHNKIVRPTSAETAMYVAQGAAIRTACLSRQVGACLVDKNGNVIATGTNEVPRAGGGVYGSGFYDEVDDGRCAYRRDERLRVCSNTREQNRIVEQVIKTLPALLLILGANSKIGEEFLERLKELLHSEGGEQLSLVTKAVDNFQSLKALFKSKVVGNQDMMNTLRESFARVQDQDKQKIVRTLRKDAGIGELLEFTRAVHAEMEALLAAARKGISTVGSRMFVTTYPCHLCAPQIVCAGVDEVQYIEPYPKSRAYELHKDAIVQDTQDWIPPSQMTDSEGQRTVLFHPFVGVAPRLYARAFLKDRDLKDKNSGMLLQKFGEPEWGSPWHLGKLSYVQLEAELSKS